jgi:hypothetical protein
MGNTLLATSEARKHLAFVLLFLSGTSCASYTTIPVAQSAPGYDVRVSLSDQGAVDVTPRIGARARQLEGTLTAVTDTSLVLSVRRVAREGGGDDTYSDLLVALPSRDIGSVERSQTSMSRSVLAAGAIVATALLAAKGAGDVSGGKTGGPQGNGK